MTRKNKFAILGSGNIGLSLAQGLVEKQYTQAAHITLTRRNIQALSAFKEKGFQIGNDNLAAVLQADIIVLAVLPQQLNQLLAQIAPAIQAHQIVISVISGVNCADIQAKIPTKNVAIVRAMPNTAIAIGQSMTCVASQTASKEQLDLVLQIFENVGMSVIINEELMTSATALCACGIAFFLRAIRAASQGGVEIGFHAEEALKMAIQTAKGAADLLLKTQAHPEHEIDKVTSPKGCTIAGLNEMEHNGFSSSLIKGIKLSALKASGLYIQD